jgi:hypothetical protein
LQEMWRLAPTLIVGVSGSVTCIERERHRGRNKICCTRQLQKKHRADDVESLEDVLMARADLKAVTTH